MKRWIAGGRISPGMKLKRTSFQSSDGLHEIAAYFWDTTKTPARGVVQIIHGMREHTGRYAEFAKYLCFMGYSVCGHDHIGHGESARDGVYGHFGKRGGANALLADCRRMSEIIRQKYPGQPLFLLGHSMGSFAGRILAAEADGISGFICSGTGGANPAAAFGRALARALVATGHGEKPGKLLDRLAFGDYNARWPQETSKMAWLSRDENAVKAFEEDKHTQAIFTYGGFCDLLALQAAACGGKWAKKWPKELPILLISGEDDPVGGYGRGVANVLKSLEKAGAKKASMRLYPGARHELLNETNREAVYLDIYRWMEENRS